MTKTRIAPLAILILSVAVVGAALLSQYWGGLRPCELCLYERWPYYAVAVLTAIALAAGQRYLSRAAQSLAAPPVRCDEVQWSLFGISLAGWNFVASVLLAAIAYFAAMRLGRTR